jgi:hypothetical protein
LKKDINYEIELDDMAVKAITGFFKTYYKIEEELESLSFHIVNDIETDKIKLILQARLEV